eukprot:scaffold101589_cov36-Cyclotella_meneghiniana.AAC.3
MMGSESFDNLLNVSKTTRKTRGEGGGGSKEEEEELERESDAEEEDEEKEGEEVGSNEGENEKVPAPAKKKLPARSVKEKDGAMKNGSVGKKGFPLPASSRGRVRG